MLDRRQFLQLTSGAIAFRGGGSLFPKSNSLGDSPPPKFWFGDYVCQEKICDDELDPDRFGKPLRDYGVIIGLFFSSGSKYRLPGWNYFISWSWVDGEAINNSDWDSVTHESDLKLSNRLIASRCH